MGEALSRFPLPEELQVVQSCWQRIAIFIWGSGLKHGDLESAEIKLKITSNLLAKFSRKYLTQKNKWVSTHKSYLEPQIQMPEKTHPSHHSQDFKDAKQRSNTTRCKGKRQLTKKKRQKSQNSIRSFICSLRIQGSMGQYISHLENN